MFGASPYNMLENSSFRNGTSNWTGGNLETGDTVITTNGNNHLKINGNAEKAKYYRQDIAIKRPASECGVNVSGKAMAKSVAVKDDRNFLLVVTYLYSDGSAENRWVTFNPDTYDDENYQFTSKAVYPSQANLTKTTQGDGSPVLLKIVN